MDTRLVLSAAKKTADLMPAVDWFEIFRPAELGVFMRLDQTEA